MKLLLIYTEGPAYEKYNQLSVFDNQETMLAFVNDNLKKEGFEVLKIVEFVKEIHLQPIETVTKMEIKP